MDPDLVIRAQQGDEQAFASLAGHLYGQLRHVALRILRDEELAKDATQQAALDMWRYLPRAPRSREVRGVGLPPARRPMQARGTPEDPD